MDERANKDHTIYITLAKVAEHRFIIYSLRSYIRPILSAPLQAVNGH